ncbi:hypothetical protein [Succinivibrio sp.]|uniref:hypothetical protein n=1 Tax=Succinivibrio sp. TaxID=2053619 RepID=UPI00386B5E29
MENIQSIIKSIDGSDSAVFKILTEHEVCNNDCYYRGIVLDGKNADMFLPNDKLNDLLVKKIIEVSFDETKLNLNVTFNKNSDTITLYPATNTKSFTLSSENEGNALLILKKKNRLTFHLIRQFSLIKSILEKYSLSTLTFEKRLH